MMKDDDAEEIDVTLDVGELRSIMAEAAEAWHKHGKVEPKPDWSKIPSGCECFERAPLSKNMVVDLCVNSVLPVFDAAYDQANMCRDASFVFLGAMLHMMTGRVLAYHRAPAREGERLLDEREQAFLIALIDDACLNAKDRLKEAIAYVRRKVGN